VVVTLSDACADATAGTLTLTVANATAGTSASTAALGEEQLVNALNDAAANVSIHDDIDGLANVDAATTTVAATSGDTCTLTITFPNTTGTWTVTAVSTLVASSTAITATVATATPGVPATTLDFVDDDLATNTMITVKTTAGATAAGAAGATRTYYNTWVYDSGDVFSLTAAGEVAATVTGASEAAFETEAASFAALTNDVTISYRTGATTSGISYFILGT
jgi:hypothetical protein